MKIVVGHLYPDYLNIYADRGNIAVLAERARLRGHVLDVRAIGMRDPVPEGEIDLFYVGGGQDREQELIAPDLARKGGRAPRGRRRGRRGARRVRRVPAARAVVRRRGGQRPAGRGTPPAAHPCRAIEADDRRRAAQVRLGRSDARRVRKPRGPDDPRRQRRAARPRHLRVRERRPHRFSRAARAGRVYGTYLHGPLLPRNPWFADLLLAEALAHLGAEIELEPLDDGLEREAHAISAERARSRGGR